MGHLKLAPPFNVVVSPRVAQTRRHAAPRQPAPQPNASQRKNEDDAVAEIAQRFAPGAHLMADADAATGPSPDLPQGDGTAARGAASAFKSLPQSFQSLILALVLIALLPSLTLTALVWFGPAEITGFVAGKSAPGKTHPIKTPRIKTASLVDVSLGASEPAPAAAPDTIAAADTGETGEASLAAPHRLQAQAGQAVPFAIALASVEPLPSRSVIAVTGLPAGATLSAGRPYTDREWNVRPDELSGLRLYLPETAQGETMLEIALIASDGETLAEAQTALKVTAPAPAGTAAVPPAFDPYAGPSIGDVAALRVPVHAQMPQGETSEPQASETEPAEAEAAAAEPEQVGEEAASGEAASSEAASGETASEPASGPADNAAASEAASGEPISESTSPASGPFADSGAKQEPSLALSDFVNLRARPTSSARVIAVMAKGAKVTPKAKRRGWLKVTDAASGKTGWIYGRYAGGSAQSASSASPSRLGAGPSSDDDSLLTRFGRWLVY